MDFTPFFNRRTHLSVQNDCLLYEDRVVVPKRIRNSILRQLHQGHPGSNRMRSLARTIVYWPKMDEDITRYVNSCGACAAAAKLPVKTLLHTWPKTIRPWQRIHIDFAGPLGGHYYLVIVDSYSKYPEIIQMTTTTATATVRQLRHVFSRHGIPETIVSDNGTQFSSAIFKMFCIENNISYVFSPPYHPQSNGQAERFVDTLKRAITKLKGEGTSEEILDVFLTTYRTTPNVQNSDSKTPAEILYGRKIRTSLELLRPPTENQQIRNLPMEDQFNNHHGAKLRTFKTNDLVYARRTISKTWQPGTITDSKGVIYSVRLDDSTIKRFHANQLRARSIKYIEDPLEILNDTFSLPTIQRKPENLVNESTTTVKVMNQPPTTQDGPTPPDPPLRQSPTPNPVTGVPGSKRSTRVSSPYVRPVRVRRPPQRYGNWVKK